MLTTRASIVAVLLFFAAFVASASVGEEACDVLRSEWQGNDYVELRLVSAHTHIPENGKIDLALEIKLRDGWVTYWKMPGVSGFPPKITAKDLKNVDRFDVMWPAPSHHELPYSDAIGYDGHLLVPISAVAESPLEDMQIKLDWQIAVCEEICVLLEEMFALTIPAVTAGAAVDKTADHSQIAEAKSTLPVKVPQGAFLGSHSVKSAAVRRENQSLFLDVTLTSAEGGGARAAVPELYVAGPAAVRFGTPAAEKSSEGAELKFTYQVFLPDSKTRLEGQDLTLVLVSDEGAFKTTAQIALGS